MRRYTVVHSDGSRSEDLTIEEAVDEINRVHIAGLTTEELELLDRYGGVMRDADGAWSVKAYD